MTRNEMIEKVIKAMNDDEIVLAKCVLMATGGDYHPHHDEDMAEILNEIEAAE